VRFLADESCYFAVVKALREVEHDVTVVAELSPAASDDVVLQLARMDNRILLTEDKDFGLLAYAGGQKTARVILIRFPAGARNQLGQAVVVAVAEIGERLNGAFVVLEPGRARVSKPPLQNR
jgi:predicted nuclease of predicted toxin-antitoxin system